jgi:hypothetical protein
MEEIKMPDESKGKIVVVTTEQAAPSTMRGARDEARKVVEEGISVENLQRGFTNFMNALAQIVKTGHSKVGDYTLDQISFSAEIGAEGEFKLLGTGVGVSGSAGVTFTLRRQPSQETSKT